MTITHNQNGEAIVTLAGRDADHAIAALVELRNSGKIEDAKTAAAISRVIDALCMGNQINIKG